MEADAAGPIAIAPGCRVVHVVTASMSLAFLRAAIAHAKQLGMDVQAIASPDDDLERVAKELQIPIHACVMPRRITPVRDLVALWQMTRLLHRLRPNIVHAQTPKGGLLGMMAATLANVPVRVYHLRGLPLEGARGPRRSLLTWTERIASALAHRVIAVGPSVRERAIAERITAPHRIVVLERGSGQGVDADGRFDPARLPDGTREAVRAELGIPAHARVIGFVGRLVRDKGIVELARAWATLRAEFDDAHLLVVGGYEAHDPVPADVRAALATDVRAHLVGPDWDTPRLYAAMDVVALPTYREGFPNVPLEAAAMGLPVVATRIPGCSDAVETDVTGLLVPVRDSSALADALRRYLCDGALRAAHGRAGRRRVLRDYVPERIAIALHEQYAALLRAGRARR